MAIAYGAVGVAGDPEVQAMTQPTKVDVKMAGVTFDCTTISLAIANTARYFMLPILDARKYAFVQHLPEKQQCTVSSIGRASDS